MLCYHVYPYLDYVKEVTEYAQISRVSISIEYVREVTEHSQMSCINVPV